MSTLLSLPLTFPQREKVRRAMHLAPLRAIKLNPIAPLGRCYWNIADLVAARGGAPVFGWRVLYLPKFLVVAEHHCIWRAPNGALVDFTPTYASEPTSTFSVDGSIPISLERPPLVPVKYYALSNRPEVLALMEAGPKFLDSRRADVERALANGGRFDSNTLMMFERDGSFVQDSNPELHEANNEAFRALFRLAGGL